MKLNWGLSIGIVYTLFALSMILFAVKASEQKYDLVKENYYDDAVNYQKKIDAGNNSVNSGSHINMDFNKENRSLEVIINGGGKITSGFLQFYKPDKASMDFKVDLATDENGHQFVAMDKVARGQWKVEANWNIKGKDCYEEKRLFIP